MLLTAVTSFAKSDTTSYVDEIMVFKVDGSDIFARYIKAEPCNQEENSTLAIIIAGSGPTDANGNNPFLKSYTYKYLAEELGRHEGDRTSDRQKIPQMKAMQYIVHMYMKIRPPFGCAA